MRRRTPTGPMQVNVPLLAALLREATPPHLLSIKVCTLHLPMYYDGVPFRHAVYPCPSSLPTSSPRGQESTQQLFRQCVKYLGDGSTFRVNHALTVRGSVGDLGAWGLHGAGEGFRINIVSTLSSSVPQHPPSPLTRCWACCWAECLARNSTRRTMF